MGTPLVTDLDRNNRCRRTRVCLVEIFFRNISPREKEKKTYGGGGGGITIPGVHLTPLHLNSTPLNTFTQSSLAQLLTLTRLHVGVSDGFYFGSLRMLGQVERFAFAFCRRLDYRHNNKTERQITSHSMTSHKSAEIVPVKRVRRRYHSRRTNILRFAGSAYLQSMDFQREPQSKHHLYFLDCFFFTSWPTRPNPTHIANANPDPHPS